MWAVVVNESCCLLTLSQILSNFTMPKISKRRQPHGACPAPRGAAILSQEARKVSFEEASHSSSTSSDSLKSCQSLTLIPRTSPCTNMLLMSTLLERKPTPTTTCLSEMDSSDDDEENSHYEIPSRTVSQEEEPDRTSSSSPWGQFVDVIPEDHGSWTTPTYEPVSPVLHCSPAYHPYYSRGARRPKKTGLSPIPNKLSSPPTRKLQQRRMTEVEGAFEQLRF